MAARRAKSRSVLAAANSRGPVAVAGATGDKGAMGEKDRAGAEFTLDQLAQTIDQRAGASADASYTRSLLDKGAAHCARKFGEEAIELAIAAAALDESAVRAEAADVLYHLLVVLRARGIALSSVMDELGKRSAQSGHEEKASRTKSAGK
jgi:phosphoribosyl-ATP pyrophosphohydrolase